MLVGNYKPGLAIIIIIIAAAARWTDCPKRFDGKGRVKMAEDLSSSCSELCKPQCPFPAL